MVWRRRLLWTLAALAAIAALGYGFMPTPQLVDTARVGRGTLRVSVEQEGKTRVVDRFILSAPVTARLDRIDFHVGDKVEKGQVLANLAPMRSAILDPSRRAAAEASLAAAKARLLEAKEMLLAAEADSEYAETEFARVEKLVETRALPKSDLDQARTTLRRLQARKRSAGFAVEVAGHGVLSAQTALDYSGAAPRESAENVIPLACPVDGSVLKILRRSEGLVPAGQALLEIGDTRTLEVEADVLSANAVKIREGMKVYLQRWGGDSRLEGKVKIVEPVGFTKISALGVEEQRVLCIVDLVSERSEWDRLGSGYRVEAEFVIWEGSDVLRVPRSALFRSDDGWSAFVLNAAADRVERRSVELGRRSGLEAEVISGLQEGDRVVVHPDDKLEDGGAVKTQ